MRTRTLAQLDDDLTDPLITALSSIGFGNSVSLFIMVVVVVKNFSSYLLLRILIKKKEKG